MSTEHIVNVPLRVEGEFLSDILVTAFDGTYGGSWYWAEPVGSEWLTTTLPRGTNDQWLSARVRVDLRNGETGDPVTDNQEGFEVAHVTVVQGIRRILEDDYWTGTHDSEKVAYLKPSIVEAVSTNDAGMIDSPMADSIIQVGVFGRVIFG